MKRKTVFCPFCCKEELEKEATISSDAQMYDAKNNCFLMGSLVLNQMKYSNCGEVCYLEARK